MADREDYILDAFDDGSARRVGEKVLQKTKDFVEDYGKKLKEIEEALDESLSEVWDSTVDPIGLSTEPYEQTKLLEITKTDNKLFDKILIVFLSLCSEMRKLDNEAKEIYFPALMTFGEDGEPVEGQAQVKIGKILNPLLIQLSYFVNRCYVVIQNTIRQLASLYYVKQKLYQTSFKGIHLQTVYEAMGDLLSALIAIDQIVSSNENLLRSWQMFKRMTKMVRGTPGKFSVEEQNMVQFEKTLLSLEGQLFDGLVYQNAIEQEFDFPGLVEVRKNGIFKEEFFTNVKNMCTNVSIFLGTSEESDNRKKFMGLCGLYVFYFAIWKDPSDKLFFKKLWTLYERAPLVHIMGNTIWLAPEFFIKKIPAMVKTLGKITVTKYRQDFLTDLDRTFIDRVSELYLQVSVWMVRMESNLSNRADVKDIINTRISLLQHGPLLAFRIANLFKTFVNMHLLLRVPILKSHIRYVYQNVELLKAIQNTFHRRSAMIGESVSLMTQELCFYLKRILVPIQHRLTQNQKYSDAKVDVLAAVTLALQVLNGCATKNRLLVLRCCLHVISQPAFVKEEEMEMIRYEFRRLELMTTIMERVREATDCSVVYWTREMIPKHLADIYANPEQANKLHYLFAALRDVVPLLEKTVHMDSSVFIEAYKKEVDDALKNEILDRLCRDIETDLRLHIHSHLQVAERDPFKNGVPDLVSFVKLRPLRFFNNTIDIKAYVSHYLDTTFYNLTTVALYNWKTYGEMRNLAKEKYGLILNESHLPGQTLEQGIDILEIMRNIHIFVGRYNYNLNNQIFVEGASENKTLDTINIGHIANSIRTHGTGIMNTTVNFTYQFLREKFVVFSQFLYDDHIKSRLFKDIKYFETSKDEIDNKYPYERSAKFNKEIRKLGLTEHGLSYLDQFRRLITEIGNAMGYIRMIRSGGLYHTSNAIKFIPDLQDVISFADLVEREGLSPGTLEAAKNADVSINNLVTKFAEGTQYFKMLVNVFATEFRDPRNMHLKNFYSIIPPLTINFVEHSLQQKEKLFKQQIKDGAFSDDGFAIGIAYILRLLDQYEMFDSLHWWDAVKARYEEERQKLTNLAKQRSKNKEDQQTLALTMKKLNAYTREFELLRFSFTGARVFFRFDDKKKEEPATETTQDEPAAEPATQEPQPEPEDDSSSDEF